MLLAESIYLHSRRLPELAAREAFDFIQFLEQRYAKEHSEIVSQKDTESFLASVTGKLNDDFPNDITGDDLGVDTPRLEFE